MPVAQAEVELKSATSEWRQTTTSNASGEFAFMTVPLGDYVLTVTQADFAARAQNVTVTSGSSPVAHVQLSPGPAMQTVTVTAPPRSYERRRPSTRDSAM